MYVKIRVSVQTRDAGNSYSLFKDGGIIIDYEGFVYVFNLSVC